MKDFLSIDLVALCHYLWENGSTIKCLNFDFFSITDKRKIKITNKFYELLQVILQAIHVNMF